MSSTPPPSTPEQEPSPGPPPPPRQPSGGAPDGPPSYEPTMANRIAAIGFTCSIGCLPVLVLGVATREGLLLAASGIMWLLGLGLSVAALSKQERPSPNASKACGRRNRDSCRLDHRDSDSAAGGVHLVHEQLLGVTDAGLARLPASAPCPSSGRCPGCHAHSVDSGADHHHLLGRKRPRADRRARRAIQRHHRRMSRAWAGLRLSDQGCRHEAVRQY